MSFMVSEEVTVKEGGPRMIVMKPSLFRGRGVVLRKKFERVSLTPGRITSGLVSQCLQ